MRLDELKLRDYRCFESIDIKFHPQLTVLIAPNGGGKTSILDVINLSFLTFIRAVNQRDRDLKSHQDAMNLQGVDILSLQSLELNYSDQRFVRQDSSFNVKKNRQLQRKFNLLNK